MAWKQTWYQPELIGHEMSDCTFMCANLDPKFVHQGRSMDRKVVKLNLKKSRLKKQHRG